MGMGQTDKILNFPTHGRNASISLYTRILLDTWGTTTKFGTMARQAHFQRVDRVSNPHLREHGPTPQR